MALIIKPVTYAMEVYANTKGRRQEFEADQEAVRNGYGRQLEGTLKRAARDELENVNPHPVIEALEYDHPSLANRVRTLREEEEKLTENDYEKSS